MGGETREDTMATVQTFEETPEMLVDPDATDEADKPDKPDKPDEKQNEKDEQKALEFSIRQTQRDDLSDLLTMYRLCSQHGRIYKYQPFEDRAEFMARTFLADMENPRSAIFIARDSEGKPLGFLIARIGPLWSCPGVSVAYSLTVWVQPEARGEGVGRGLINALTEWATEKNCTRVFIGARMAFNNSRRTELLYRDLGFKVEEKTFVKVLPDQRGVP